MTETLEQRITRHEGSRLKLYIDTRGFRTIGTGRNLDAKGINEQERIMMLQDDIDDACSALTLQLPWTLKLDEPRQEVLIEMVFQLGINGVLAFKNTLAHIQAQEWDAAADAMLQSAWHLETPARCEELAGIMRAGTVNI